MQTRRGVALAVLAFGFVMGAMPGYAAPYSEGAFAAAQAAGKPILVHVTAPWCPVCKAQHPILTKLEGEPALKDLVVFDVDFDTSKPLLRTLGVQKQSTLIVYHGKEEKGRSTGETDEAALKALLLKATG